MAIVNPVTVMLLFLSLCAQAADWQVRHVNANDAIREGGPIPIRLEVINPTGKPVEGRIESVVQIGDEPLVHHVSAPLVLVPGKQIITHLLPSADCALDTGRNATLHFVTAERAIPLGTLPLLKMKGRRFVLAHVKNGAPKELELSIARRLHLEGQAPDAALPRTSPDGNLLPKRLLHQLGFDTLWLEPEDMPSHPLALCAYDCVVLYPEALLALRTRQYDALAQWVDSGGRLLIFASKAGGLSPLAIDNTAKFLERLGRDDESIQWTRSEDGGIVEIEKTPRVLSPGCGRVVIYPTVASFPVDARLVAARLTGATNHIWPLSKFGADLRIPIQQTLLNAVPSPIPPATILQWMLGFILVAVAGDYLLLGWLRRRKYTWFLFPVLAVSATVATVIYAQRHMNAQEQRGTFRVVDLGLDGRVLRQQRFTAILPSKATTGSVTISEGISTTGFEGNVLASAVRGTRSGRAPMQFEGNLLSETKQVMPFNQWMPIFTSSYSPAGGGDDSGIRWDAWQPAEAVGGIPKAVVSTMDRDSKYQFLTWGHDFEDNPLALLANQILQLSNERLTHRIPPPSPEMFLAPMHVAGKGLNETTLVIAIRRDGPDIVCYRKFQRITKATTQ